MNAPQVKRVLRSPREIRRMRRAGLVVWEAHQAAARILEPGVTTERLNEAIRQTFRNHGATPLFLGYGPEDSPFPAETCISVNEEIVHGIPGDRKIRAGDIVSIDTGCSVDGWCGDAAITHAVGNISVVQRKLIDVTQGTLELAIDLLSAKTMWSEIATEMMEYVAGHGFSTIRELTGHGIGRNLHEPPQVPNYWSDEFKGDDDFDIRPGVVIACEPMVNEGTEELDYLSDEWTAVTRDRKMSAHFEHTIAITGDGPVKLTQAPGDEELELVSEEFRNPTDWVTW